MGTTHQTRKKQARWGILLPILSMGLWGTSISPSMGSGLKQSVAGCPPSALEQTTLHVVQPNETIESLASTYALVPSSILAVNPSIPSGTVKAGDRLQIPPYNGSVYSVSSGTTWQELADQFGMRADVLFEANGCSMTPPATAFIPGLGETVSISAGTPQTAQPEPLTFNLLPVQTEAAIALEYGWQQSSLEEAAVFHSGIDFSAPLGTTVTAVADGTVAFAGEKGTYGQVVVINHARGVQTRYAQLSEVSVRIGDTVSAGESLGLSGQSGNVTTPHLHFEVRLNSPSGWIAQDPYLYLNSL